MLRVSESLERLRVSWNEAAGVGPGDGIARPHPGRSPRRGDRDRAGEILPVSAWTP